MKRDAMPDQPWRLPAHIARPATPSPVARTRAQQAARERAVTAQPLRLVHTALRALLVRELSADDLARAVQRAWPEEPVRIGRIVNHALDAGWLMSDGDGLLGLTDAGATYAAALPERTVSVPPEPTEEAKRRRALVPEGTDSAALTRSAVRPSASSADLAPPPTRPGADACLEIPSRFGDTLRYRDGRITDLQGHPLPAGALRAA